MKLPDDTETQITLNVKLNNFTYNERNTLKDLFIVKAYCVDKLFITNKKKDSSIQPTTLAFTSKQYLIDYNLLVEMTNQTSLNNYIYFVINPNESNKNKYANYSIEIIAHSPLKVPVFVTPQNRTYIGTLNSNVNINYYLLNRESEDINYIVLYFTNKQNNKQIAFSVECTR